MNNLTIDEIIQELSQRDDFKELIMKLISQYIIDKYGNEVTIKEYFEENIFN